MEETQNSRLPTKRSYFDWQLENYEKEMFMSGHVLSNRPIPDLLQNCDLPTPLKFFSPIGDDDKKSKLSNFSPNSPSELPPWYVNKISPESGKNLLPDQGEDSVGLLRALQLSQTRAREAEREAMVTCVEKQQMAVLLLEESLRLSAHKQWVRLLEAENSVLRKRELGKNEEGDQEDDVAAVADVATWCFALALCLGIAGVGLALGKCLF